jgi:GNAT superfamily N-acetyltransferase
MREMSFPLGRPLTKEASTMNLHVTFECSGVNWSIVSQTLQRVGMAYYEPDVHRKAFETSHTSVFVYNCEQLVGFGRAISDDAYQAAVYDMAVDPEYQGQGIGTTILKHILQRLPHCNVILYAAVGKEGFYKTMGFRRMKTGMALFKKADEMQKRGFTD